MVYETRSARATVCVVAGLRENLLGLDRVDLYNDQMRAICLNDSQMRKAVECVTQEKPVVKSAPNEGGGAVSGHMKREEEEEGDSPWCPSSDGSHRVEVARWQAWSWPATAVPGWKDSWRDEQHHNEVPKLKEEPNKVLYKDPQVVRTSVSRNGNQKAP